jgi:hypothetical protein
MRFICGHCVGGPGENCPTWPRLWSLLKLMYILCFVARSRYHGGHNPFIAMFVRVLLDVMFTHCRVLIETRVSNAPSYSVGHGSSPSQDTSSRVFFVILNLSGGKAVPLHSMEALGGRGGIAPTYSRPQH